MSPTWPRILLASLGLVLALDVAFVVADLVARSGGLSDPRWLVTRDRGYAEMFQYGKTVLAAIVLARMAFARRSTSALVWALLFAALVVDDSLQVHERAGYVLASLLPLPAFKAARPHHIGELLFYAVNGVVVAGALAAAWLGASSSDRRLTRALLWGGTALVACAVGLDVLSSITHGSRLGVVVAVTEDGGELFAMTALLFIVLRATQTVRRVRPPRPTLVIRHQAAAPAELDRQSSRRYS